MTRSEARYEGSCHCGAVRFAITSNFTELTSCDCSICRRKNALMVKVHESRFELLAGEDHLSEYRFHTGSARHLFCRHCGIKSFYVPRSHPDGYSINARCLDEGTVTAVNVVPFDDANRAAATAQIAHLSRSR